ncbi:MAG: phosphoribosylanthranilate isomerase [Sphaerochaeta sp.]|nr:phosphoribosylanthranilate isomerase [Sphaerochaeta sp.]
MTKIKLCGLTEEKHIRWANEAGCDYIGFVFAPSRRRVSFEKEKELRKLLSPSILPVGVFVDAPIGEILSLCRADVISLVQLHGNEEEGYIQELRKQCQLPIIRAIDATDKEALRLGLDSSADFLLLDAKKGGSGVSFDWEITKTCTRPYFLAGGLHPDNLKEAVTKTRAYALDLSSGLEEAGEKTRSRMLEATRIAHAF